AFRVAMDGSEPWAIMAPRMLEISDRAGGLSAVTCCPRLLMCTCSCLVRMVVTDAMPMLAPMLRMRLNRLVALPIFSLGIGSFVSVVNGMKISPIAEPCRISGQKKFQYPTLRFR